MGRRQWGGVGGGRVTLWSDPSPAVVVRLLCCVSTVLSSHFLSVCPSDGFSTPYGRSKQRRSSLCLAPQQLERSCFSHLCCSLEGVFRQNVAKTKNKKNLKMQKRKKKFFSGGQTLLLWRGERRMEEARRPGRSLQAASQPLWRNVSAGSRLHFSHWLSWAARAFKHSRGHVQENQPV